MRWSHPAVKWVDIGFCVVSVLILAAYYSLAFGNNDPKTRHQDLAGSEDYLGLIRSTAEKCDDAPVEELPDLRRQWCVFSDASALLWVFDDSFTDEQKHAACSSRGIWAIVRAGGEFDFCLTNVLPSPDSTDLGSIGRELFQSNTNSRFEKVFYPDDSLTPRSSHVYDPAGGSDFLIGSMLILPFLSIFWIVVRVPVKRRYKYRTLLAVIRGRLQQSLAAAVSTELSEKILASSAGSRIESNVPGSPAGHPDADVGELDIAAYADNMLAGAARTSGTAYLTPTRFVFVGNGKRYEIPHKGNIFYIRFLEGHCFVGSIRLIDDRLEHIFYLAINQTADVCYWHLLLRAASDGHIDPARTHDDIDQLLKSYKSLIYNHARGGKPSSTLSEEASRLIQIQRD